MEDLSKITYEARIISKDGKLLKEFKDDEFLEKINQCLHITALYHKTKETLVEIEKAFLPLKPYVNSLIIETRGGNVVCTMSLKDFLTIIKIGKRIKITERFLDDKQEKLRFSTVEQDIRDILTNLGA